MTSSRITDLLVELAAFRDQASLVRQVFDDTTSVFERLETFPHRRAIQERAALDLLEEAAIRRVFEKQPGLVVLGRAYLRSVALNLIVGERVMPDAPSTSVRWRGVNVVYGRRRSTRKLYRDDDDIDAEFEMPDVDFGHDMSPDNSSSSGSDIGKDGTRGATAAGTGKISAASKKPDLGPLLSHTNLEYKANEGVGVYVEVNLPSPVLEHGVRVVSCASHQPSKANLAIDQASKGILPFFVFALDLNRPISDEEEEQLQYLRFAYPESPVLFVGCNESTTTSPHARRKSNTSQSGEEPGGGAAAASAVPVGATVHEQALMRYGFFGGSPGDRLSWTSTPLPNVPDLEPDSKIQNITDVSFQPCHRFLEDVGELPEIYPNFLASNLNQWVLCAASLMRRSHLSCLTSFIHLAMEMSRDVLLTPRRILYVKRKEHELFAAMMDLATLKQAELRKSVELILSTLTPIVSEEAAIFQFQKLSLPEDLVVKDSKTLRRCAEQIKGFVFERLTTNIASQMSGSVHMMKESLLGTLQRCVNALEEKVLDEDGMSVNDLSISVNNNGDVPSPAAPDHLPGPTNATTIALQELLSSCYHLEFSERVTNSTIRLMLERLRDTLRLMPWKSGVCVDASWRRSVAEKQVENLSSVRLSKTICSQFKVKVTRAHEHFMMALNELESTHAARLQETGEARVELRKQFAPRIARLALHSTALVDRINHGMPQMTHELGRGQYGVVYASDTWASHQPVCVKSVVPPDEKHWNDLAMEFHYMWTLPIHDRIVTLHGVTIDYTYGSGATPAVLLIMERMNRDLHSGIKHHMSWVERLQVAGDVIEGIRFLHARGLIHRDIKLKNVLLDANNRGKITDLGFCKPEAMMTMSLVGTPIHMAPELFDGAYSSSIDVYAFGILFWYICSNQVKLPAVYDRCHSKDQLWHEVRRGLRPERLKVFEDGCWRLMCDCWSRETEQRPLPGSVSERISRMMEAAKEQQLQRGPSPVVTPPPTKPGSKPRHNPSKR
ncbi:dual serine/threonine and tyrosine protein kinase-like [Sycon ciliatum]|uniref:dual serine/threonine and tyrosine protein kinase-like n=1 Tax=Sycon ciliatum TaxID=27933 RepID=UPI0031F66AEF